MIQFDKKKQVKANIELLKNNLLKEQSSEFSIKRKDGTTFPILVQSIPRMKNKKVVGIRSVILDISDKILAEKALRESEKRYKIIFDSVYDAILVENRDGKILDVNKRACEIYGFSYEEFLKTKVTDIVAPGATLLSLDSPNLSKPVETINI